MHALHIFGVVVWAFIVASLIFVGEMFASTIGRVIREEKDLIERARRREESEKRMIREYWEARRGR